VKQSEHIFGKQLQLGLLQQMGLPYGGNASRVGWHFHDGFEILFVLEGATAYEFKSGETVELHGGEFLVVPPHIVHRGKHDVRSPSRICGLALTPKVELAGKNTTFTHANLIHLSRSLKQSAMVVHPLSAALRGIIQRLMGEADAYWNQPDDAVGHATLRTLICDAILEAVRQIQSPSRKPDHIVAAAKAYLNQHYLEPLSVAKLGAFLGYSRSRTFELFKSQTGLTPKDYLVRVRVEKAEELLRQTRRSIIDIAHSVGFNSSQYFSTVFRRYTGQTPAEFRQNSRNGDRREQQSTPLRR
jgi:AraC-like DNA-binding protein/mannose-6-phosphate isomerase-like protein (cupin superfamily)